MIKYDGGSFGFKILLRLHGSAAFKAIFPSLVSCIIYIYLYYRTDIGSDEHPIFDHPYPMGALISALTFLLAFRANFSYNRYWEAVTAVHQMHSKWLDVAMELSAFHLQASCYDKAKPPAFGAYPELLSVQRERERLHAQSLQELQEQLEGMADLEGSFRQKVSSVFCINSKKMTKKQLKKQEEEEKKRRAQARSRREKQLSSTVIKSIYASSQAVQPHQPKRRGLLFSGGKSRRLSNSVVPTSTILKVSTSKHKNAWDPDKPPLFLQETAHLLSLLSAVAMSTLRNDLEDAPSPLITFEPGAPWPHVDPDSYQADVRKDWAVTTHRSVTVFKYLIGISRTPANRTLYNAARPFRVVGGVSDAEIELLQAARGPLAKVALCTMWLQEFITREALAGSTGQVAPPILSRIYQNVSDGMLGYNQARKVSYIPFPFPHAQITSLFVFIVVALMPTMMLSFVETFQAGFLLNLVTVMCFTGLHEVSRELENPFRNVPNDLPLNNFQAQYNEGLMTMFAGYHPDAYWDVYPSHEPSEAATTTTTTAASVLDGTNTSQNLSVQDGTNTTTHSSGYEDINTTIHTEHEDVIPEDAILEDINITPSQEGLLAQNVEVLYEEKKDDPESDFS